MCDCICRSELDYGDQPIEGVWAILGGSAARFCSEGRTLDRPRRAGLHSAHLSQQTEFPVFSEHSDLDISIVFDVENIEALITRNFGKPGRGFFAEMQVPAHRVAKLFEVKTFFRRWGPTSSRKIEVLLPRTRRACRDRWSEVWKDASVFVLV